MIKGFAMAIRLDDIYVAIGDLVLITDIGGLEHCGRVKEIECFGVNRRLKIDCSEKYYSKTIDIEFKKIETIKVLEESKNE